MFQTVLKKKQEVCKGMSQEMESFPIVSLNFSDMPDASMIHFDEFTQYRRNKSESYCYESGDMWTLRSTMARAAGKEISKDEAAKWTSSKAETDAAAFKTAKIIILHKRD